LIRTRILTVIVLLPIVLFFAYLGGLPWLLGILLVGVVAWREMSALLQRTHFTVDHALGYFFIIGAIAEAYLRSTGLISLDLLRPLLAALIMFSLIWALFLRSEHPTVDWGMTVASALYLGFMLSHFVTLRQRPNGLQWLILAFAVTWAIDAAAFFSGRLFGRHTWWPRLSPKKTWEGLIGGSIAGIVTAMAAGYYLVGLGLLPGLMLGILAAVFAPAGDLAVSLFKRTAGAKDTGQIIPGHGGMLDRLDSLLFVVPLVTYFAVVVAGP
jgi:phosphatidate cytidylyltransferase